MALYKSGYYYYYYYYLHVTRERSTASVGKAFSHVCESVCLSVCLSIRAVTGKRLDLSTPKSMAGRGHGLTLELKLKGCKVQVEECECHTP